MLYQSTTLATLFVGLLLPLNTLRAQAPTFRTETRYEELGSESREHPLDIERMRIDLSFDIPRSMVMGTVKHFFRPIREKVDSIVFDGVNMTIKQAYCSNRTVRFMVADSTVTVYPDPPLRYGVQDSIQFDYECTPRKGMHFTGWKDNTNRARKQIWTQGEDSDNRFWCPLYDYPNDKMLTETVITFDSSYQVLSNGNLIETRVNSNGTKTWHYAMTKPHVTYLIMIAIGRYAIEERKSSRGLPLHLWYYPEYPERVKPTYQFSAEMMEFMENILDTPFPWESYSQVPLQDYTFGAMENTTATTFGDFSLTDARGNLDRKYLNTNVHELTHQWFGDYVTERDWKSIWLHESFATFYPKMFQKKFFGEDQYQWMRRGEQNSALAAGDRDRLPIVHTSSGTARRYDKGSAVLDMLRYVVGEKNFDRAVSRYLRQHAYGQVNTTEFYLAFQNELGLSLDWFFHEWLYHGGEPVYTVDYKEVLDQKSQQLETVFTVEQKQFTDNIVPLFSMPIVFEVHYTDGTSTTVQQTVSAQHQIVSVPNKQKKTIAYTLFDPGSYILKKVTFKKSFQELRSQAELAVHMIDRYDAVKFIRDDSTLNAEETENFMTRMFEKEKFHAVKSEIVAYMLKSKTNAARSVVRKAINDSDVDVRKAAINNIHVIPEELRADYEKLLEDSSYVVIESTFKKLCEAFPDKVTGYESRVEKVHSPSARVEIALLEGRALKADPKARAALVDYASTGFEFQTRQNAMSALRRVNYCDEQLVTWVVEAVLSSNNRLADAARSHVEYWIQQAAFKKLFTTYYNNRSWEKWQKNILAKLFGEPVGRRTRR